MTLLNGQMVFSLEQDLAVAEQETVDDVRIEEAYRQQGVLLLKAETQEGVFRRTLAEFQFSDESLKAVQGLEAVDFEQLDMFHEEATADHQVEFPFIGGLEIESDLANSNVAMPPHPSVTPYEFPDDPVPIPAFALHWPTITPVLTMSDLPPGEQWPGKIAVQIGAGQFSLSHSVKLVEYIGEDPLLEIVLAEQEQVAMVGMDEDIALRLAPQGTWRVLISHEDSIWKSGSGEIKLSVRAQYKEDEDAEEEIELEILKWENKFKIERIPVTFDDDRIFTKDWNDTSLNTGNDK